MTTSRSATTDVVVVDGSNIATEGRAMPSLAQLNDAVLAFKSEFPDATVTVVVDATFGHRIGKSESRAFDEAVAHNELVAPPAGAIGRGDAFVLSIANKVGARVLSNDSFQEFHGEYPWLFDAGRLIGGKPVPYVGWVFVERLPVKGPASRKSQRAARGGRGDGAPDRRSASKAASQPMPVPKAPPPGGRTPRSKEAAEPASARSTASTTARDAGSMDERAAPGAPAGSAVNELLPFLDFVERHPVGTSVNGVVESYSSHGAYVQLGDIRGYVPLRLMSDPPPRSAREVMRVGDAVTLVVATYAPARRSVDLAVATAATSARHTAEPAETTPEAAPAGASVARRSRRSPAASPVAAVDGPPPVTDGAVPGDATPAPRTRTRPPRRAAAATAPPPADEEPPAPAAPRRRTKKAAAEATLADVAVPSAPDEATPAAKRPSRKRAATPATEVSAPEPPAAPPPRVRRRTVARPADTDGAAAPSAATSTPTDEPAAEPKPRKRAARKRASASAPGGTVAEATPTEPAGPAASTGPETTPTGSPAPRLRPAAARAARAASASATSTSTSTDAVAPAGTTRTAGTTADASDGVAPRRRTRRVRAEATEGSPA